jgi:radical SAM superfamily enzyme YgiQ (UPF0313 family)
MKIKIIEPYDFNPRYDQRSLTPSPGPVVVATLLKQAGHDVEVLSEYVTEFDIEELDEPDLVGISITTANAQRGFEIAKQIRKPVVFGGFHATLMPEECLGYGDYVIRGDGYPIVDLASDLETGCQADCKRIPNLVYKRCGRTIFNHIKPHAVDVVPDFGLVKGFFRFNSRRLLRIPLMVNGSRGCTYDCTFCSIKAVYPEFKKKSVETVVKDIKAQIRNQHFLALFLPRIIWLTDDNLTSDKKWAKALFKEIAKLNSAYHFTIQVRVDAAYDDELLALMKRAGIGRVYVGIESLRPKSLQDFRKNTALKDVEYAAGKFRKFDIDVHGLFIFGDDEFQRGDGKKVAKFIRKNKMSGLLIQPLTPFPGTPMFAQFEKGKRLLHKNWRWYGDKVVIKPKNMSPAELQKEIYDCYLDVFSPLYVLKSVISGRKGFKLELLGEAIFRHLEWQKMKNYIKERLNCSLNVALTSKRKCHPGPLKVKD